MPTLTEDLLAAVTKPKRMLQEGAATAVPLGTVHSHCIIRLRSDGRYGVAMGVSRKNAKKRCVDFWFEGRELVDGDALVDVLPHLVVRRRDR